MSFVDFYAGLSFEKMQGEREMKGVGEPLLCIGDLLSDLKEKEEDVVRAEGASPSSSLIPDSNHTLQSFVDITDLFQENFRQLNEAFARTDHSWTVLTLKLCTSLENERIGRVHQLKRQMVV